MDEQITKEDLRQFGRMLIGEINKLIKAENPFLSSIPDPEWLKGRKARQLLDISSGSLQNLRTTGKVRFRKVMGSYYYNKADLMGLFNSRNN